MINGKKIAAIIQARMTSTRLPGKVLMPLNGKPALQRVIERLRASKVDDVIVATTINEADDAIVNLCEQLNCGCYRGSEEDVLSRVLEAAKLYNIDVIVEITADCPLIDPSHVNILLDMHGGGTAVDMTSNIIERTFPRGYDIRIVNIEVLERIDREVDNGLDRQHVLSFAYLNPKGKQNYLCLNWAAPAGQNRPEIQVTLDTQADYELLNWIFIAGEECKVDLSCQDVISLLDTYNPECYSRVQKVERKDYFSELQESYENMPQGGFVEAEQKAMLHKDSPISEKMSNLLKEAVNAIKPNGIKNHVEIKKRGRKPKTK